MLACQHRIDDAAKLAAVGAQGPGNDDAPVLEAAAEDGLGDHGGRALPGLLEVLAVADDKALLATLHADQHVALGIRHADRLGKGQQRALLIHGHRQQRVASGRVGLGRIAHGDGGQRVVHQAQLGGELDAQAVGEVVGRLARAVQLFLAADVQVDQRGRHHHRGHQHIAQHDPARDPCGELGREAG